MLKKLRYKTGFVIAYLFSLLPFRVMHRISDLLFFISWYLISYRKSIVLMNLKNSFPGKSEREITRIAKQFYRFFFDLTLETLKTLSMTRKQALRHCRFDEDSFRLLEKLYAENKDLLLVLGHYGNWELAGTVFSSLCSHQLYVIYKPLSNPFFDRLVYHMRSRWGTKLIATRNTYERMNEIRGTGAAVAFIADQSAKPDNAYWTTFLNQETPVFWGTELISKKFNIPVVYMTIRRERRGKYKIFIEMLVEKPRSTRRGEISEAHTRKLERDILAQPELWLWSHRRWKYERLKTEVPEPVDGTE